MPRKPKNKALVVGIGSYPGSIPNLPAVSNDVREIAKVLGSKQSQFSRDTIEVLRNRVAKKKDVLASLKKVFRAGSQATVFVYLAGHGGVEDGHYYYVSYDANPDDLANTAVSLGEIRSLFDKSPSQQAFLWLDFCHSGGIIPRNTEGQSVDGVLKRTLKVVQGQGKVIVAACTETQSAYEGVEHGFFTGALLEGLKGGAMSSGEVTVSSLYDFIDRKIGSARQRPMLFGKMAGRIVLMHEDVKAIKPAVKKTATVKKSLGSKKVSAKTSTTNSSGKWVLLGEDLFFESKKVSHNPDGSISIDVNSNNPELDASFKSLRPGQFGLASELQFAHQNDAVDVRVKSVAAESVGRGQLWHFELQPVERGNGITEMAFSDGNRHYSADDIAELRARRILLGEVVEKRGMGMNPLLLGLGHRNDLACSIQEIYAKYSSKKATWPKLARLKAIATLKTTGTVQDVLELSLRVGRGKKVSVSFKARRASKYHNEPPAVISFKGECPLG